MDPRERYRGSPLGLAAERSRTTHAAPEAVDACRDLAALWAFCGSSSFREGALAAVHLGHDADSTGAVDGQQAIPAAWRARPADRDVIETLADNLYAATCT